MERRLVVGPIGVLLSGEMTIGEPRDAGPRLGGLEGVFKSNVSFNFWLDLVSLEAKGSFPVLAAVRVGVISSPLRARFTRTPPLEIPALGVEGETSIFEGEGEVIGTRERQPSVSEPEVVLGLLSAFFLVSQAKGTGVIEVCFLLIALRGLTAASGSTELSLCSVGRGVVGALVTLEGGMNNSATLETPPP